MITTGQSRIIQRSLRLMHYLFMHITAEALLKGYLGDFKGAIIDSTSAIEIDPLCIRLLRSRYAKSSLQDYMVQ